MSKSKAITKHKKRASNTMSTDQRLTSLLLVHVSRSAIETIRDYIAEDCARALSTLDMVETWLENGGCRDAEPAQFDEYRASNDGDFDGRAAQDEWFRKYAHCFGLVEHAIWSVMDQVTGKKECPIDFSIVGLRERVNIYRSDERVPFTTAIAEAIDRASGSGRGFEEAIGVLRP
jgi:hypothetical protein